MTAPIHERAVIELWGACIQKAIMDALGNEPTYAEDARQWLSSKGLEHLLNHPGAASLSADGRKKRTRRSVAAAAAGGDVSHGHTAASLDH